MVKRSQKTQKTQTNLQKFVAIAFAEDLEQAKDYEALLKINDIPTVIKEQGKSPTNAKSIAVMVHEDFLDEAHVVIEHQDAYDDFYDFALEDEDDSDFDNDLFDDDF